MKGFGRIGSGVVAAGTAAVVFAALTITSSQASWTDTEYDEGTVGALDCVDGAAFDTTAWGRMVTAELAGSQIDSIAELNGITVDNLEDADPTVSEAHDVASPNDLTDNAWSSNIDASALELLNVSLGVPLFAAPDTGAYTQYGDAEASGQSTGAAGVITTSEGGVSLGSSDPEAPGVGSLSLSGTLSEVIGDALGSEVANLADLGLSIGAVSSMTSLDACAPLWAGEDLADYVTRDYLIAGLDLSFESALVGDLVTGITGLVNALDTDPGTPGAQLGVTVDASELGDTLDALLGGLGAVIDASGTSVTVAATADLSSVLALLNDEISDTNGFVTIDLGTGLITVDLEAILGSLNGLPPNTPILTPAVLNTILGAIEDAVTDFVNDVLEDALTAALGAATIAVDIDASLTIAGVAGVGLHIDVDGPLSSPTANVTLDPSGVLGLLTTALGLLGIDVNVLLANIVSTLTTGIVTPLVDAITTELDDLVTGVLTGVLDATDGLLPALLTALTPIFDLIRSIVEITVNVQPDAAPNPDAPIPPDVPVPGRFFESAIRIALLDPASTAPDGLVELYLANSSAGPNTPR